MHNKKEKIRVVTDLNPVIAIIGGKTYVVGGSHWIEVPDDTTLDDIIWIDPMKKEMDRLKALRKTYEVLSSNQVDKYNVILEPNNNRCNCMGFKFHRHCKHLTNILNEINV